MSSSKPSRKDKDRRGDDEYSTSRRDGPKTKQLLDEFFLDGEGIDREVLQSTICRFLGAEATCRPHEHEGRKGYKIRAMRQFTPAMLQDLKEKSADFRDEAQSMRARGGTGNLTYAQYETGQRYDDQADIMMDVDQNYPQRTAQYSSGTSGSPYSQAQNPSSYGPRYSQDIPTTYPMHNSNANAYAYPYPGHSNPGNPSTYAPSYPSHTNSGNPNIYAQQYQAHNRDPRMAPYAGNYRPSDDPYGDPAYQSPAGQWTGSGTVYSGIATESSMPTYGDRAYVGPAANNGGYSIPSVPPRAFDGPYGADPYNQRPGNPDFRPPPPGGGGPPTYGQTPRDQRDRDPRDVRGDTRDSRDYNGASSSRRR